MIVVDAKDLCCHSGRVEGCLSSPDDRYTMSPDTPYRTLWCSHCGPLAAERRALVEKLLKEGHGEALRAALLKVAPEC